MKLEDLHDQERRALVVLINAVIRADGKLTDEEIDAMSGVAEDLGQDAWRQAFRETLGKNEDALDVAATVERPEARALIRTMLAKVAESDLLVKAEKDFLDRLDAAWS